MEERVSADADVEFDTAPDRHFGCVLSHRVFWLWAACQAVSMFVLRCDRASGQASEHDNRRMVMGDQRSTEMVDRAFAFRPVLATWALTVGVDLFFNAGVFMPVFDQEREPSLLPDEVLFRRIPVAYLALLAGVISLAWIIDRIDPPDARRGVILGTLAGVVFSLMGVVYLWTAVEMTGAFVAAGSLVVIVEFASAGWTLSAFKRGPDAARLTRRILLVALFAAVAGIVIQNLHA